MLRRRDPDNPRVAAATAELAVTLIAEHKFADAEPIACAWSLLDDFRPPGRSVYYWYQFGSIASDQAGNLYVSGFTFDPDYMQPDQGYVRRSTDGGATWTTVDDFVTDDLTDSASDVTGIAADAAGDVYVSGSNERVWTIRKGVGGTSFSTVDTMASSYPYALFAHPTAGIFAVGRRPVVIKSETSYAWTVRLSTNGGATWSDVDTFQLSISSLYSNPLRIGALGIGAAADGSLYVVGMAHTKSRGYYISHWLVRKSTDGGNSWNTVDDFQPSGSNAEARCFAATSNGDVYVAGVTSTSGVNRWVVRKNPGGTGAWSTIDDYQYAPGVSTEPHAIVADGLGNLFVGGSEWDGSVGHWLIKRY
jgi:hypothetical protein